MRKEVSSKSQQLSKYESRFSLGDNDDHTMTLKKFSLCKKEVVNLRKLKKTLEKKLNDVME